MKKVIRVFLILAVFFLAGCGTAPIAITKESLNQEESLVVAIEGYYFYQTLGFTFDKDRRPGSLIVKHSPLRNDAVSRGVIEALQRDFPAALRERGIMVSDNAPIKIAVNVAQSTDATLSTAHIMGEVVVKYSGVATPVTHTLIKYNKSDWAEKFHYHMEVLNNFLANGVVKNYQDAIKPARSTQTSAKQGGEEKKIVQLPLPLNRDVKIIAPGKDIPEDMARFSGIWDGVWDNKVHTMLVVEEIHPPVVVGMFAIHNSSAVKVEYDFLKGTITPQKIELPPKQVQPWKTAKIEFFFEGGELRGVYRLLAPDGKMVTDLWRANFRKREE